MQRRLAAALLPVLLLLAGGCAKFPVSDEVKIEFRDDSDAVLVTAETTFDLKPANDVTRSRIESARASAQSGTDPWSLRFSRLTPELERLTYQKDHGVLERVTHVVSIPGDDLQRVFADTNVTVEVLRGDTWRELRFYPGTSTRATREQQRRFASELSTWSEAVARYFAATHHLYSYMNEKPGRARYLFAAILHEKREDGSDPLVSEEEQPFVDDVERAMDDLATRMDEQEGRASTFAEEADLVFNPFPARISVSVPTDILSTEGFTSPRDRTVVIEPVNLFASIAALEGKWITPDPLAALLRDQTPTAEGLAQMPRRSAALVSPTAVADAIREQLAKPKMYALRWRD
jgi:hypothetical protein